MSVIGVLICCSILVAAGFLGAFLWAVRTGQYDDKDTPSIRILFDDAPARDPRSKGGGGDAAKETNART